MKHPPCHTFCTLCSTVQSDVDVKLNFNMLFKKKVGFKLYASSNICPDIVIMLSTEDIIVIVLLVSLKAINGEVLLVSKITTNSVDCGYQ